MVTDAPDFEALTSEEGGAVLLITDAPEIVLVCSDNGSLLEGVAFALVKLVLEKFENRLIPSVQKKMQL